MLIKTIDLDLEDDLGALYSEIVDSIKYLTVVKEAIDTRVLNGEEIEGLAIKPGNKVGSITPAGYDFLAKIYGEELIYEKKGITQTALKSLVAKDKVTKEDLDLVTEQFIEYKQNKSSVKIKGE